MMNDFCTESYEDGPNGGGGGGGGESISGAKQLGEETTRGETSWGRND